MRVIGSPRSGAAGAALLVGQNDEEVLGQLGLEQAVGERAVGRGAGHRDIPGDRLRGVGAQLADVGGDRARVPAGDRAGQRGVAGAQGVVQGGAEQRAEHPVGGGDPGLGQQLHRLGDQGDQVVGAQREGSVVERARLLGDPLGLAAHLDDEGLGREPQLIGGGDAEGAAREPLDVDGGAGERHRGVQRERQRPGPQRGVQHPGPVPPGGVDEELARPYGAGLDEALDQRGQHVVGDGQEHQLGAGQHLGGLHQGHIGEQGRGAAAGGVGDAGHGDRTVSGELERRGEGGSDPARADDADGETGGAVPRVEGFLRN